MEAHFPVTARTHLAALLNRSLAAMPRIAKACLDAPVPALGSEPMTRSSIRRASRRRALAELERNAGPALWTSPHWRSAEGIRIVALAGLREAENPKPQRRGSRGPAPCLMNQAQAA